MKLHSLMLYCRWVHNISADPLRGDAFISRISPHKLRAIVRNDDVSAEMESFMQTRGSNGCLRMTQHENLFCFLFPRYQRQVFFGTGKGGYKAYGVRRYCVDFYDPDTAVAVEIDGKGHRGKLQRLKDRIKEIALIQKHGVSVIRLSHAQLEQIAARYLAGEQDWEVI